MTYQGSPQGMAGAHYGQNWPAPPPPELSGMGKREAPSSVKTAQVLWLLCAALGFIPTVLEIWFGTSQIDSAIENSIANDPTISASDAQQAAEFGGAFATGFLVAYAIVAAIFTAFVLWFIWAMGRGGNWARILLTIIGTIALLFGLMSVAMSVMIQSVIDQAELYEELGIEIDMTWTYISLGMKVIQLIAIVAAIVFMFRGDSNNYFRGGPAANWTPPGPGMQPGQQWGAYNPGAPAQQFPAQQYGQQQYSPAAQPFIGGDVQPMGTEAQPYSGPDSTGQWGPK
ncbi:MAG: hypothetical protein GX542_02090 [Rhodococcus sp.]|nr:hypothetical protein [Rhodococcus sp. (in: high G+C Gram-positive bacteria)]